MNERKLESESGWQRALWELGWWLLPCACHWHGRLLWRARQRLSHRILRQYPESYLVEIDGPWNDPDGTVYTYSCNDPTSSWHYSSSVTSGLPKETT